METCDPRLVELAQRVRTRSSLWAVALTASLSFVLATAASRHRLAVETLQAITIANAVAYGLVHGLRYWRQTELERRSDDAALVARLIYLHPARVTDLDLAAYWLAFAALVPAVAGAH